MTNRQSSEIIFGFDSAWMDKPRAPGAICAITFNKMGIAGFKQPRLASFAQALKFIEKERPDFDVSLVAIDQPTVVPNTTGSRPVDKVAAALVSFVGGGVQPANRSKLGLFGDDAPIWNFLTSLKAKELPRHAKSATHGNFVVEVFPALALPSLHRNFAERLGAPKYNPKNRRKFRTEDWYEVAGLLSTKANEFGVADLATWANTMVSLSTPNKADQDMLDSALCALIGLIWRAAPPDTSVMIGDIDTGYMISPISTRTRPRLEAAALKRGVSIS